MRALVHLLHERDLGVDAARWAAARDGSRRRRAAGRARARARPGTPPRRTSRRRTEGRGRRTRAACRGPSQTSVSVASTAGWSSSGAMPAPSVPPPTTSTRGRGVDRAAARAGGRPARRSRRCRQSRGQLAGDPARCACGPRPPRCPCCGCGVAEETLCSRGDQHRYAVDDRVAAGAVLGPQHRPVAAQARARSPGSAAPRHRPSAGLYLAPAQTGVQLPGVRRADRARGSMDPRDALRRPDRAPVGRPHVIDRRVLLLAAVCGRVRRSVRTRGRSISAARTVQAVTVRWHAAAAAATACRRRSTGARSRPPRACARAARRARAWSSAATVPASSASPAPAVRRSA